jgi:hypothetical protein
VEFFERAFARTIICRDVPIAEPRKRAMQPVIEKSRCIAVRES